MMNNFEIKGKIYAPGAYIPLILGGYTKLRFGDTNVSGIKSNIAYIKYTKGEV